MNDLQQQVQNITSKGRYGDTMLMHVNPIEVEALAQNVPLTITPETGLPEAFLPMLAPILGSMLGPAGQRVPHQALLPFRQRTFPFAGRLLSHPPVS